MGMFKGGGGFLNNVVGTIVGNSFDTMTGEGKNGPWTKLSLELQVLQDGQTEPVQTFLDGGFLYEEDGVTLSADKLTLEGGDGAVINGRSEVAQFIGSILKASPEVEGRLDADGRNFQGLNGLRVKFVKVLDEERTQRQGKQKSKDGSKEYSYQQLRVAEVLGAAAAAPAGKPAAKATAAKGGTTKAKAPAADVDYSAADAAIKAVLAENKGEIDKGALSNAVVKYALAQGLTGADRESLRKQTISDEFIASAEARGIIVTSGKKIVAGA